MKFLTRFQTNTHQAALVDNGKIVKMHPEKPPRTINRMILAIGRYNDFLVIGKRGLLELWDLELKSCHCLIHHPHIMALHEITQLGVNIVCTVAGLDKIFEIDLEGNEVWGWWAHEHGYGKRPHDIYGKDWQRILNFGVTNREGKVVINSLRLHPDGNYLATLLMNEKAIKIDRQTKQHEVFAKLANKPHDFQILFGNQVYGRKDGLMIGDKLIGGFEWVKRIYPYRDEGYIITHQKGVSVLDLEGKTKLHYPLSSPFGIVMIED